MHHFQMPCLYKGKKRKVFFYYTHVAGKPPASPLGPRDCKDLHVRVRQIRLSMAEQEELLPLHDLLKGNTNDNNNYNNDNGHGKESESNVNGGNGSHRDNSESDVMPANGENQIPAANEVTPLRTRHTVEVVNEAQNKLVYWDLPEAAKLVGFDFN